MLCQSHPLLTLGEEYEKFLVVQSHEMGIVIVHGQTNHFLCHTYIRKFTKIREWLRSCKSETTLGHRILQEATLVLCRRTAGLGKTGTQEITGSHTSALQENCRLGQHWDTGDDRKPNSCSTGELQALSGLP
jgi:hypothetical protein